MVMSAASQVGSCCGGDGWQQCMGQRSDRLPDLPDASKVGRCAGSGEARGRAVQATKKVREQYPDTTSIHLGSRGRSVLGARQTFAWVPACATRALVA
jgi:hypothetical protein